MLKQRIITALILLLVLAGALAAPWPGFFMALWFVSLTAAGWEWARLNGTDSRRALALALAVAVALSTTLLASSGGALLTGERAALQASLPASAWLLTACWIAVALWLPAAAFMLHGGVAGWRSRPRGLRLSIGLAGLALSWLALLLLYLQGLDMMLSAMALVWAADVAAYFAGRAFGGRFIQRKLAPSVSPNKSWEGALGGAAGALALALVWVWVDRQAGWQSLYTTLLAGGGWAWLVLSVLLLTAVSVLGDLVESLVKRAEGAKDSSQLLPGHGGVLDRVDALLPTLPLALVLASIRF